MACLNFKHQHRPIVSLFIMIKPIFLIITLLSTCNENGTGNSITVKDSTVNSKTLNELPSAHNVLKPQIGGFAVRDFDKMDTSYLNDALLSVVNSFVVKAYWKDLQPDMNGDIKHPNVIDNAIDFVRKKNAANPNLNARLKLRVYCGVYAPSWVKDKAGTFPMFKAQMSEDVPRFWEKAYLQAYANLQQKLAEAYDAVPEILDVVNGGTGTETAESLIRNVGKTGAHKKNALSFAANNYHIDKDVAAIKETILAMKAWKQTRVSMAFSPFALIDKTGYNGEDVNVSESLLNFFVETLGTQAVMGNNGLRDDDKGTNAERWAEGGANNRLYALMEKYNKEKGIGLYFQTAVLDRIGKVNTAIETGIEKGAGMIELPGNTRSFSKYISLEELKKYDAQLEAQAKK